ncbi:hydrogen gas-evolving membrane-bound hydrogenase subunit E [Engelhardtia mirabilis]|uniref:Na(+)/H(+) antiporter subunit A n=1 Tax=Engelhardtia mirabilis TaxID=2528011 RepID=A0A518BF35_9BACT|nr:Na(+)/H(+) antiporter subunit A [Planctomycetes bacterium Pla133]QDU99901.1 Na(+)/H(+) antiporter subunit A [Planctomycetes bacterium Pla86]
MFAILATLALAAFLAPSLTRWAGRRCGWILALAPGAALAYLVSRLPAVIDGETFDATVSWVPALDVSLDLRLDGLSMVFGLLITAMGVATMIYAAAYIGDDQRLGRLNATLLAFMLAMLGVVLADDVITLFVAWELTGITSYLLIGYDNHKFQARRAALQALLVTGLGGLVLLVGLTMLSWIAGTTQMSAMSAAAGSVQGSPLYGVVLAMVLVGAFTKSAQFPFHFWLPGAMAAPTPVSAFLHSATMVKAGVYLLARMQPVLGGTEAWHTTLGVVGATTMLLGAVMAFPQRDLKKILAYTTVSALGMLTMLIGIGTSAALVAAMAYVVVHALYKGPLFHVAGIIDHETGTRELSSLGGLRRTMPITAAIAAMAALSMAAVPPLLGAYAKQLVHAAEGEATAAAGYIYWTALATGIVTTSVAVMLAVLPFWRAGRETPKQPHEAPISLWLGAGLLATLALLLGPVAGTTFRPLVDAAARVAGASPSELHEETSLGLASTSHAAEPASAGALEGAADQAHADADHGAEHGEHGSGTLLKLVTIATGVLLVWRRDALLAAVAPVGGLARFGPEAVYRLSVIGLKSFSGVLTRFIQNGYLRSYIFVVLLATIVLAGYPLFSDRAPLPPLAVLDIRLYEGLIVMAMLMATLFATGTDSRLAAVVALGLIGIGVAINFMIMGGPDLAMTQLAIETLSVLLFVFILHRLPRFEHFTSLAERRRDLVLSLMVGAFFTSLVWGIATEGGESALSPYFAEHSLSEGKGHNVVNVILVDFRGLDTMGEITVLAVAALGVFGLMRLNLDKEKKNGKVA